MSGASLPIAFDCGSEARLARKNSPASVRREGERQRQRHGHARSIGIARGKVARSSCRIRASARRALFKSGGSFEIHDVHGWNSAREAQSFII
jgi:hypothetical protein